MKLHMGLPELVGRGRKRDRNAAYAERALTDLWFHQARLPEGQRS